MECCTYLAPLKPWFALHLCGRLDQFSTEKVYFYVYVRYESRLTSVRILLSLSHLSPDTGTGSEDSNRTLVGPLAQPLSNQTSRLLTPLHTLSFTHPLLRASMEAASSIARDILRRETSSRK